MTHSDSYYLFIKYLKTTSYYEQVWAYYQEGQQQVVSDTLNNASERYFKHIKKRLDDQELVLVEGENFWLQAAKQGFIFYKYSCYKFDVDGFLVFALLIEMFTSLYSDGRLFTEQAPVDVIEQILLMCIDGESDFEQSKLLVPQDVVCLVIVCILTLEKAEQHHLLSDDNPVVCNIKTLIKKISSMYPTVFDSFFAVNLDMMMNVTRQNKAP